MPRRHRTESRISPRRLAAAEKHRQALELCLGGASYDQIARTLGYRDRSGAFRAVGAAQALVVQPGVELLRWRNMERLNRMRLANWPSAVKGDPKAVETELHIQEREARYMGLDAQPTDAAARAVAVAAVNVLIQVGDQAVPLGEWRKRQLEVGDDRGNGEEPSV